MTAEYLIVARDLTTGDIVGTIPRRALLNLNYERRVNDTSSIEFQISGMVYPWLRERINIQNGAWQTMKLDTVLEVWRRPSGLDRGVGQWPEQPNFGIGVWYRDEQFFMRYIRDDMLPDGRTRFTVIGKEKKDALARADIFPREALPPEGKETVDFTSVWPWTMPIETTFDGLDHTLPPPYPTRSTGEIMEALYDRAQVGNTVALDTTYFNTVTPGTVAGIPVHTIGERYSNLLETLQNASAASWFASYYSQDSTPPDEGIDFDLTPDPDAPYWPWTFELFVGGRGVDRRTGTDNPLIFSVENGNVVSPTFINDRLTEITRTIVAGAGTDMARDVILMTSPDAIAASPLNKRDDYIDARNAEPLNYIVGPPVQVIGFGQLVKEGFHHLKENGERQDLYFTAGRNIEYGIDYNLGDLVTATLFGQTRDYQIRNIAVRLNPNGTDTVTIECGLLDGTFKKGRDIYQQMIALMKETERKLKEGQAAE